MSYIYADTLRVSAPSKSSMNLTEFKSALPKPWLNIKANSVEAKTVDADVVTIADLVVDSVDAKQLTFEKTASVPNPPVDKISLYANSSGVLTTNDELGNAVPYVPLTGATFSGDVLAPHVYSSSVPVSSWRGGMTGTWASIGPGSVAETDMINNVRTGSLTIPDAVASGFTLKMKFIALFTSGGATTSTLRFKVNGTTVLTSTVPAALVVNKYYQLDYNLQVLENTRDRILTFSTLTRTDQTPLIEAGLADGVWNPAGNNTVSVTLQFSDVNGTWVTQFWDMWSSATQSF